MNNKNESIATQMETPVTKRRGRPRKNPVETVVVDTPVETKVEVEEEVPVKRRSGRPRKNTVETVVEAPVKTKVEEEAPVKRKTKSRKNIVEETVKVENPVEVKEEITEETPKEIVVEKTEYEIDICKDYGLFSDAGINVRKLNRDLKTGILPIPNNVELRRLVTQYYQFQKYRMMGANQAMSAEKIDSGSFYIKGTAAKYGALEEDLKKLIDSITNHIPVCNVIKHVCGIGPVIAAGLYSYLDIRRANSAGSFWRYAGVDPTIPPKKKGEKTVYNQKLKVLAVFKLGESFIKVKNIKSDFYGKFYDEYKEYYIRKNDAGGFAEAAKEKLENFNIGKNTEAYKYYSKGCLPPAHIHSMARRKPVTIFLSHLFDLEYMLYHNEKSPRPYIIAHDEGHIHEIENPLIDIYEDLYGHHPIKGTLIYDPYDCDEDLDDDFESRFHEMGDYGDGKL